MSKTEQEVREIILSGFSQHRFLESIDTFYELTSDIVETAVSVLANWWSERDSWRSALEMVLDYQDSYIFSHIWEQQDSSWRTELENAPEILVDAAMPNLLNAAARSREDAITVADELLAALHDMAIHSTLKEIEECCEVAAKVAISEVAGVFAENWDDDEDDEEEDEEEDDDDEDGPEKRAYEVVGGDIEGAAENFLEGAKALLVGQKPIPGLTWPAGLNESIADAAVEAVRTVSPNYAGDIDTGWAQKVFQNFGIEQGDSTDSTLEESCEELRQLLEPDVDRIHKTGIGSKFLVILSGLPGTGKSYFAEELSRRFPCLVLGSDRLRKRLNPRPSYGWRESGDLFTAIRRIIPEYLGKDVPIVFDATNLAESHRQPLYSIANTMGTRVQTVRFTASPAVIRRRLEKRESTPNSNDYSDATRAVYRKLAPTEEPIHGDHLLVSSPKDVPDVIATIVSLMQAVSSGAANVIATSAPTVGQDPRGGEATHQNSLPELGDESEERITSLYDFIDLLAFQDSHLEPSPMFSPNGQPVNLAGHAALFNGWGPSFDGALDEATGNRTATTVLTEFFRLFPWEVERLQKAESGETYANTKNVRSRILLYCKKNKWTQEDRKALEKEKESDFEIALEKFTGSQNGGFDSLVSFLESGWQDPTPLDAVALRTSTERLLSTNPDNAGLLMLHGLCEALSWNGDLAMAGEHLLTAMNLSREAYDVDEEYINRVCISVFTAAHMIAQMGNSREEAVETLLGAFHRSIGMNRELARELSSLGRDPKASLIPMGWLVNQLVKNSSITIQKSEVI